MWQVLISILFSFSLFLASALAYDAKLDHYAKLKSKFPYGLLSDDHGILTINDLARNACLVKPKPFIAGVINPYQYWICFENKNVLPTCDDELFINEDGHVGRVNIEARDNEMVYQFFESRPWNIRDCRRFVKTLKRIMKGTSHACVSASYIDKETKNERGQNERVGIIHRFKTLKGCEGEECELTEKFHKEFCPNLEF